jgi:hypothetical protein
MTTCIYSLFIIWQAAGGPSALGVSSDFLMSGSNNDQAQATLTDRELLNQFQKVELFPNDKKAIVKELLDSFLLNYEIQNRMS